MYVLDLRAGRGETGLGHEAIGTRMEGSLRSQDMGARRARELSIEREARGGNDGHSPAKIASVREKESLRCEIGYLDEDWTDVDRRGILQHIDYRHRHLGSSHTYSSCNSALVCWMPCIFVKVVCVRCPTMHVYCRSPLRRYGERLHQLPVDFGWLGSRHRLGLQLLFILSRALLSITLTILHPRL